MSAVPEPYSYVPVRRKALIPNGATNIRMIYVDFPGGRPDVHMVGRQLLEQIEAMNEPLLHISFTVDGRRLTTLTSVQTLAERGLPTDYETLSQMFPNLEWSAS